MSVAAAAYRLRRLPAPATEPPYDEFPVLPVAPVNAVQGTLALTFTLPSGVPAAPTPVLRVVAEPPVEDFGDETLPPLRCWADTLAMAIAQILTGERTPGQFRQWTLPEVFDVLARHAALAAARPRRRAALRAVRICSPAAGVAEVTTVVHGLTRPKALAFRLESRRSRWLCTALEVG